LVVAGLAVLALAGCGAAASNPDWPGVGIMGGANGTRMMGGGTAGSGTGDGPMMSAQLSCTAPDALPGSRVTVALVDMDMRRAGTDRAPLGIPMRLRTSTTSVPAGQVSFVAENLGARSHELVVLRLAVGQQPGTRAPGSNGEIAENGSVGEASNACGDGSGDGVSTGTTGWVTLTLPPGRYELVCNEANHYADGMYQELVVT
jgi:uncharacterized cupredoxin-like copper-binding protein